MENALKSLKSAEERASSVEAQTTQKASDLVRETEESMKRLEADVERRAREAGEGHLASRLEGAKAESAKIRDRARADAEGMEKKAKDKMASAVDQVEDAVIKRMKSES